MSEYDPIAHGARCAECPLQGKPVIPPEGPAGATFAVVGEAPIREDEIRRRPYMSAGGRLLEEMLEQANLDRSEVWLTNTLLCRPRTPDVSGAKQFDLATMLAWIRLENVKRRKRNEALIVSPIECCRPRLLAELSKLEVNAVGQPNGAVVLALGNTATHALTNKQGVLNRRGSPVPIKIEGTTIHARWDPRPQEEGP